MKIRAQLGTIVGATAALLMSTTAHAGSRPFMPRGESVAAPPGYADLCARGEEACGASGSATLHVAADAAPNPAGGPVMATSSIGYSWPERVAAAQAAAPLAAPTAATHDIAGASAHFASLEAYRPAIAADFVAAGAWTLPSAAAETAPVAQLAQAAPSAAATNPLLRQAQMRLINNINREVNRDVHKATDFDLYGLMEYWSLPRVIDGKMYGDCEDYALEKRRRLIEAGVPAEAMSMAVAITARGESHAVLVVAFESGDWVLDNLTPWATPWEDLNYHWVQRQVAGSTNWTTIG